MGVSLYIKPAKYYNTNVESSFSLGMNSPTVEYILFDNNNKIVSGSNSTINNFSGTVDEYFSSIYHPDVPLEGGDHTLFLELARIYIAPTSTIKDLADQVVDTRTKGNKLLSNLPVDVVDNLNTNSYNMFSLINWGESAFPANSVIVIRLPDYVLDIDGVRATGDTLTQLLIEIRKACKKHLATGILPIVRFYDSTTGELLDIQPPLDRSF
jgi:hypothetical protein